MKGAGTAVLLALLALGVLSSLGYVLYLSVVLTVVYGIIAHPKAMATSLGLALLAGMIDRYPLASFAAIALASLFALLRQPPST